MLDAAHLRRSGLAIALSFSLLGAAAPRSPFNEAPSAPVARSQRDGVTRGRSPMLVAVVGDADADALDVMFYGRQVPAADVAGEAATFVVVPDPQKYTRSEQAAATYREQMRWIVRSRERLGIAFVIAVGDLVQRADSAVQWQRASDAWRILDDADVPYSVVPGNHDMTSEGNAALYDRLFPPERFDGEPWYGGWMGYPHDGIRDPADRGNANSYQLVNAAGLEFLILNIEVDLPLHAVRWARDVMDAYPDHHVVLVTHRWMGDDGVRWRRPLYRVDVETLSPEQAWARLVAPSCSVVLVLAGHDPGESRRQDVDECGQPVFQLMADYQNRPRGGAGWLRYYTIDPEAAAIEAWTYSVTSDSFELDGDSRFTLAWTGSGEPFTVIGSDHDVPSGGVATMRWSGLQVGAAYEWYAVADDGSLVEAGARRAFTTPPVEASIRIDRSRSPRASRRRPSRHL